MKCTVIDLKHIKPPTVSSLNADAYSLLKKATSNATASKCLPVVNIHNMKCYTAREMFIRNSATRRSHITLTYEVSQRKLVYIYTVY
jgi:hypothetical protein